MNEISPVTAGIGHNLPPLADLLVEETAELKQRAQDLAAAVGRAAVTDDDTAGKGALLVKMITTHRKDIDAARVTAKEPHLANCRTVDIHFKDLDSILATTDSKGKVLCGPLADMMGKLDTYRREQERKAAEERRRLEEEARKQREAAEAAECARREAEAQAAREAAEAARKIAEAEAEARRAGDAEAAAIAAKARAEEEVRQAQARQEALAAELAAKKAQEQAEELARQAQATAAPVIDSGLGVKAYARTVRKAIITDWTAAGKHAWTLNADALKETIQKVYDAQIRAGVKALPGARIEETTETRIR